MHMYRRSCEQVIEKMHMQKSEHEIFLQDKGRVKRMKMEELFEKYGCDTQHKEQAVFASIFILQNRLQTAGEKLQTEISMKQWLLLAMAECCPEPRTLTNIGELMGCSRQNIKKLAAASGTVVCRF